MKTNGGALRQIPVAQGKEAEIIERPAHASFLAVGQMLDTHKPQGLCLVLPFISQLHSYAYGEARARNIPVALVPPSNVPLLSGMLSSVVLDAVVTTDEYAPALVRDLSETGQLEKIRVWFIVETGTATSFVAPHAETTRGSFI